MKRELGAESGPTTGTRRFRSSSRLGIIVPCPLRAFCDPFHGPTGSRVHRPAGGRHGHNTLGCPGGRNLSVNVSTGFCQHVACHQFFLALPLQDSRYQAAVAVTQRAAVALTQRGSYTRRVGLRFCAPRFCVPSDDASAASQPRPAGVRCGINYPGSNMRSELCVVLRTTRLGVAHDWRAPVSTSRT